MNTIPLLLESILPFGSIKLGIMENITSMTTSGEHFSSDEANIPKLASDIIDETANAFSSLYVVVCNAVNLNRVLRPEVGVHMEGADNTILLNSLAPKSHEVLHDNGDPGNFNLL